MKSFRSLSRVVVLSAVVALAHPARLLCAPADVQVAVSQVDDDRYGPGPFSSSLEITLTLSGDGMDGVSGVRFVVKEARDDQGNSLVAEKPSRDDFENPQGSGSKLQLKSPARKAASVSIAGTAELFAPSRDPNAVVTVEKAFAKLNERLSSKGLKAAKVEVTVLSKERWAEVAKKQKPTEKDIAELRAEAKKKGASDEEIEAGIALLAGLSEAMDAVPENAVILTGPRDGMALIESVEVLGPDGAENHVSGTMTQGDKKTMTKILDLADKVDPASSLRFTILTAKARFTVPFALKDVPLP